MWPTYKSWILILQLLVLLDFIAMGNMITTNFLIIRDTTFVCKDGKLEFRRAELSDDDKLSLLESKGGHVLSSYMARDQRSAEENFINLLPFQSTEEEEQHTQVRQPPQTRNQRDNGYSYAKRIDEKTFRQKAAVLKYLIEIEKESEILTDNIMKVWEASRSHEEDLRKSSRERVSRRRRRNRHVTSLPHRTSPTPSTPQPLHSNSTALRNIPFVLPGQIGLKRTYFSNVSGMTTQIDFCHPRGSATPDGQYLHMCTTCAATTTLPENYFPRVINEAICKPEDSTCFIVEQIPQGACKQGQIVIDVLRRKDGYCTLALKNDEMVIIDDWELAKYPMNVGCECAMHKDSTFANFV